MKRVAAFALLLTACAPLMTGTGVPALAEGLIRFDACSDLLDHVKTEAGRIVTPYGLEGWYSPVWPVDLTAAEAAGSPAPRSATVAHSTTNVQEAGVDEPDIIKTDGHLIYALSNGTLYVVDVSGRPTITDSLPLENGWGEILLAEDRVIVLSTRYGGAVRGVVALPEIGPVDGRAGPVSVLTEIDVADPTDISLVRTLYLDGSYLSARMTDDIARIVVRAQPAGFEWRYPEGGGLLAEIRAKNANRALIAASTLENWVPYFVREDADGTTTEGLLIDCEDVYRPQEFSGLGMLTVVTVDLSGGLQPDAVGVLADGDTVYASAESLYVASRGWADRTVLTEDRITSGERTEIHKFDISDPSTTSYRATGTVDGYLLNQFSLSEHEGYLRVATTHQAPWWGRGDRASESFVTVLAENDGALDIVGSVGGLGRGEQIYSVRFLGEVGYVVTFRQTDPLYTIDLSDPTAPVVTGALKIPGYSAYLHPLGEGLLLGVGQDATGEGWTIGAQVSVFDVSNPARPIRIDRYTLEGAYSDVEFDHHAFLFWEPTSTVFLPVQRWGQEGPSGKDDPFVGVVALRVDPAGSLREIGAVEHTRGDGWTGQIRRSLVVGDTLFTLSDLGIAGTDLMTMSETGWVGF